MRILILSVTAGEGHNAMGKALINAAQAHDHETQMLDYFKDVCPLRAFFAQPFYFFFLQHFPKWCHKTYVKMQNRDVTKFPSKLTAFSYMTSSKKANNRLLKTIQEYQPDMIYCTHVYTANVVAKLKENGYIKVPTFYIVSDYVTHPYTETAAKIDYILTPCHEVEPTLLKMKFQKTQFLPFGITVDPKFSIKHDRTRLAQAIGIKPELFTILMISGAVGFGQTIELIENIEKNNLKVQIIVVNGLNKDAKDKINAFIAKNGIKNIINYGYVNNVHELMAVSDVMIGKLGGVGITEAFNMGLPIICPTIAPFQEYDNGVYLEKLGCIINAKNIENTIAAVKLLSNNVDKIKSMKKSVRYIARPNATTDLLNFMEEIYYARK